MNQLSGERLGAALRMAGLHLLLSAVLATIVALLVFQLWFPAPFDEMIHGRQLFLLIVAVDVVCGPLLTLVLFNPRKPRHQWRVDIVLISLAQCAALGYGLWQLSISRPILLAFEGDRFRVVQAGDVDARSLSLALDGLSTESWTGPRLVAVRLLDSTDPEYPQSVQLAMQGIHPAFRPARWMPYEQARPQLSLALRPITELSFRYPERADEFLAIERAAGKRPEDLGFLPLVRGDITDWVIILNRQDMEPVGYLRVDAW